MGCGIVRGSTGKGIKNKLIIIIIIIIMSITLTGYPSSIPSSGAYNGLRLQFPGTQDPALASSITSTHVYIATPAYTNS